MLRSYSGELLSVGSRNRVKKKCKASAREGGTKSSFGFQTASPTQSDIY